MSLTSFNQIQVGRKFRVASGIIYQKITNEQAKPIQKADKTAINNGRVTTIFYNSNF